MVRKASPMALAALAHAVATAVLGPCKPYWIDRYPLAALTIIFGTRNADTRSGPFSSSRCNCSSISCKPPMPEPIMTPQRNGSSLEKSKPLWRTASMPATSGELREAIDALDFFGREIFFAGRPIGDFAAEFDLEAFGIEQLEQSEYRSRRAECAAQMSATLMAQRGDGP